MEAAQERWELGGVALRSRLLVGTARYPSVRVMLDALEASGTDMVTVALRRVSPGAGEENLYRILTDHGYRILPNTAGCYTVKDAVLTAELAREALDTPLIKLELIADDETLLPDTVQLLEAARQLVRAGFVVLPYTNDDPVTATRLAELGCAAVMPLGAPIGSGMGIRNPYNLAILREQVRVPVVLDAGIGTASGAALAMELGCDAVLLASAVTRARDPEQMAEAMRRAVEAGRLAHLAGRIPRRLYADASTPWEGRPEW